MKRPIYLLYLLLLLVLPTACIPAAPAAPPADSAAPATGATAADPNAFPVTIPHKYGETTIEAEPQRVLSLGYGDEDAILALGIQPIALRHWFGEPENGVWPWGQAALGDAKPEILEMGFGELNFEQIALLQPDLIVAIGAGLAAEEYETLTQIAPTVVTPAGYTTQMPWQEHLRLIGQATGRATKAEAVIADVEAQIVATRAAHPEFAGKTVVVAEYLEADSYYIFDPENARIRFLNALGFVLSEQAVGIHAGQFDVTNGTISGERLDLLEADLLIWGVSTRADQATLEASPLYQQLAVVQQNRDLFYTWAEEPNLISAALSYGTVLSIPYLLENLVPEMSVALGGAPAVTAADTSCEAGFRLFDHDLLATDPICIPENPQRIIALDVASVELTLMTDKTLLATSGWLLSEMPILLPQFADTLAGAEDVGYPANLETILLLKPDLILAVGGTSVGETIDVEQAMQIAPVVIADPAIYADWKLGTGFWSEVLNVADFYAAMEANYFTRVGELQAALGNPGDLEVSVIAASTYGMSLWMPDTPPGQILSDVGLARPEAQSLIGEKALARYEASQYITISEERLDLVDGDAIFYFTYASADSETAQKESDFLQAFAEKPLWQALNAVKAGKAFLVPGYWWRSQSYLLANLVLDDLFANLTDTTATTPTLGSE